MKLIPARITSLREHKGLSQAEFAELAKIEQSYVSKLERGKAPNVAGVVLAKLATALETSVDYLLGRTESPAAYPAIVNHPALKDSDFQELADLWPRLHASDKGHLLFLARRFVAKPPAPDKKPPKL